MEENRAGANYEPGRSRGGPDDNDNVPQFATNCEPDRASDGPPFSTVRVVVRIRPDRKRPPTAATVHVPKSGSRLDVMASRAELEGPPSAHARMPSRQPLRHAFSFPGPHAVLGPETDQEMVFERVALPSLAAVLSGHDGAVIATGASGAGKTYSLYGCPLRYADRGIVSRVLESLFAETARQAGRDFSVSLSMLEIEACDANDLLDPIPLDASFRRPRLTPHALPGGGVTLRGLRRVPAASLDDAMQIVALGDSRRACWQAPGGRVVSRSSHVSSLSHVILSIHVASREYGAATGNAATLTVADLASPIRLSVPGLGHLDDAVLRAALDRNASLCALERLVAALRHASESSRRHPRRGRTHVPCRDHLLTWILRPAFGQSCRTSLLATVAPGGDPSAALATARFAQTVAALRLGPVHAPRPPVASPAQSVTHSLPKLLSTGLPRSQPPSLPPPPLSRGRLSRDAAAAAERETESLRAQTAAQRAAISALVAQLADCQRATAALHTQRPRSPMPPRVIVPAAPRGAETVTRAQGVVGGRGEPGAAIAPIWRLLATARAGMTPANAVLLAACIYLAVFAVYVYGGGSGAL